MATDWTLEEVEATVADYFALLESEPRGEPYSKAEHRRALLILLSDRSEAAVERKHQNISAVLRDLGHPWIDGYKPLGNYRWLSFVSPTHTVLRHLERAEAFGAARKN